MSSSTSPRRVVLALLASLACASAAAAHDFWIQPGAFRVEPGATVAFSLLVGHGPDRQRSAIPSRRITRLEAVAPDGSVTDLKPLLRLGGPEADGEARLPGRGTHVLVLATDSAAQSRLPAARFNDYLVAEGLTPALELRRRAGATGLDGAEIYSRRAKAIVQVGPPDARAEALATRRLGLTLEIVPERNPGAAPYSTDLPVRVFYKDRPLAGATVKLVDLDHDDRPAQVLTTDRSGRARFTLPKAGAWMLNVVWTRPLPRGHEADFETVFSSLSFSARPD